MSNVYTTMQSFWREWLPLDPTPEMQLRASQLLGGLERDLPDEELVQAVKFLTTRVRMAREDAERYG